MKEEGGLCGHLRGHRHLFVERHVWKSWFAGCLKRFEEHTINNLVVFYIKLVCGKGFG